MAAIIGVRRNSRVRRLWSNGDGLFTNCSEPNLRHRGDCSSDAGRTESGTYMRRVSYRSACQHWRRRRRCAHSFPMALANPIDRRLVYTLRWFNAPRPEQTFSFLNCSDVARAIAPRLLQDGRHTLRSSGLPQRPWPRAPGAALPRRNHPLFRVGKVFGREKYNAKNVIDLMVLRSASASCSPHAC
jgi:hypothetical protein